MKRKRQTATDFLPLNVPVFFPKSELSTLPLDLKEQVLKWVPLKTS